ncbi:MAG: hypothetical protein P8X78_04360 [Nitrosopumilaceae archaeon]
MKIGFIIIGIVVLGLLPNAFAAPSAQIVMEKTTFSYGEKLSYIIEVSEITGDLAIIHIRDETGKGSSAIPIEISKLKTEVPSPYPFEKQVFPEGKYFIDLQYSGAEYTTEFNLIDSGNIVIPFQTKQIAYNWINNQVSSGILIDSIQKTVEKDAINIPYEIDRDNLGKIYIPEWMKTTTAWWLEEKISDETYSNAFQNLVDRQIITV